MQRVVGLDLSPTSTGIAVITRRVDGTTVANTSRVISSGHGNDPLEITWHRLNTIRDDVIRPVATCQLVVVEEPAYSRNGGRKLDTYGLWWQVVGRLMDMGVPVVCCPSTTNKRFATGNGQADKTAVSAAMVRAWPEWRATTTGKGHADEGDALSLAHLAAVRLGWQVPTLKRHLDCLDAVKWSSGLVADESPEIEVRVVHLREGA